MNERPDWFNLIAAERGCPPGWSWFHSEWRGDGSSAVMLVKGGVTGAVFTRGKNKGKPNPAKRTDVRELVVSRDDMTAIKAKWSAETGKCHECYGTGERSVGWSKEHGEMKRPCNQCDLTRTKPAGER